MKKVKKFLVVLIITLTHQSISTSVFSQGVGINTTGNAANAKAGLDIDFTDKGLLIPRLTTAQRDAISAPVPEGLLIFNTTTKCFEAFVNGAWNTVSCPAACTPPAAPVSNAASGIACTSFTANWTASAGATAYLLDVATDAGFTSFVAGYNNLNVGNVTSSPVSGLAAGTAYYYRVRATTACVSGNSGTQNPVTLAAPTAAPTAGAHTPSQTQIVWNWNTVAGATGYKWNTANNYATATDNGASTTKTQTGLTCNTAYTLYVWAYNACGNFATPVTLTQTTSACCPCIVGGFPLRRPISITNTSGSALTDYQVLINVTYDTDMKADFADLRFRDGSCTDLAYWVETYTASTSAKIWVKVPSIPTTGTTIYMYYGNAGAATASNVINTFIANDLTTFTEVDPGPHYTVTSNKVSIVNETSNLANVYTTISPINNFSDDFEVIVTTLSGDGGGNILLADAITNPQWSVWGANNGIGFQLQVSSGTVNFYAVKYVSGTRTLSSNISFSLGVLYFCTVSRLGTTLTLSIFSDAARTTHIAGSPTTLTVVNTPFDKLNIAQNDIQYGGTRTYDIQNNRLRNYASPEPSHSVGAEESCN